jgi:hypothetical protein
VRYELGYYNPEDGILHLLVLFQKPGPGRKSSSTTRSPGKKEVKVKVKVNATLR